MAHPSSNGRLRVRYVGAQRRFPGRRSGFPAGRRAGRGRRLIGLTILAAVAMLLACRSAMTLPPVAPGQVTPPPSVARHRAPSSERLAAGTKPVESPSVDGLPAEAPMQTLPRGPLVVRVGLATDVDRFELSCCNPQIRVGMPGGTRSLDRALVVAPGGVLVGKAVYRLQVAALKNEQQAQGIAEYLHETTGQPADAVFNAGTDLYRVRVGRFPDREQAEVFQGTLAGLGLVQTWVASEGGAFENPELQVGWGREKLRIPGRWIDLEAPDNVGIPFNGVSYRNKISVYLNDRGRLNVINELPLEQYLRGVVPKEMGPELYDELEVLKAQSVAARTYTLRNLGEFDQEGYDICSTPRCQVYGGMAVEHPRSDKAIQATRGQVVLADGQPAETFYSATCGGHTENVEVVFPLKIGAYLRGVPCLEAGAATIAGSLEAGRPFPHALVERFLPPAGGDPVRVLSARLEHLAFLSDLPIPKARLDSLQRGEVLRHVSSVFDLALDRRLLLSSAKQLRRKLADPAQTWREEDRRLAHYLLTSGLLEGPSGRQLATAEIEPLLFQLALYLGALRHETTSFLAASKGRLRVRLGAEQREHELPEDLATFSRRGNGDLVTGPLELMAGDRLHFYWRGNRLVALVQTLPSKPVDLRRHARRLRWKSFKSLDDLRASVQGRYPGFPFTGFEVLSRGVSGRVGRLRLLGSGGEKLEVEGLAVRWTLDVYDTLFYAQPAKSGGRTGWTFDGRGWGHGVGMCQAGAYGMASRGLDYREILHHYYTGVELGRLLPSLERPRVADSGSTSEELRRIEPAAASSTSARD